MANGTTPLSADCVEALQQYYGKALDKLVLEDEIKAIKESVFGSQLGVAAGVSGAVFGLLSPNPIAGLVSVGVGVLVGVTSYNNLQKAKRKLKGARSRCDAIRQEMMMARQYARTVCGNISELPPTSEYMNSCG